MVANQLSVEMRLLHHIIARILILKTRQFDFIIKHELILMTILAWRMALNILGIMVR